MTTTKRPRAGVIASIRSTVGCVIFLVRVRRWVRQRGFQDWNALLEQGTGDDLAAFFLLTGDQAQGKPGAYDRWTVVHRLLKHSFQGLLRTGRGFDRQQVFTDAVVVLLDQGFPASTLLADRRSPLCWLLREPAIYRRLIGSMTVEDLNARIGSGAPAWYTFLIASSTQGAGAAGIDAMIEQVGLLRGKGIDVSVERLHDLIDRSPAETFPYASWVSDGLREVAKEQRRRERAALDAAAAQAMAEAAEEAGSEEAPVYVRRRM